MNEVFKITGATGDHKDVFIGCTDGDLRLTVDFDDVDRYEAAFLNRKMLAVLNAHWHDPEFAHLNLPPPPESLAEDASDEEWDENEKAWERRYEEAKTILGIKR